MTAANAEWLQSFRNDTRTKSGERARPAFPNSLPRFAVVSAVSAENSILDKARFGEPPKSNTRAACAPRNSIVDPSAHRSWTSRTANKKYLCVLRGLRGRSPMLKMDTPEPFDEEVNEPFNGAELSESVLGRDWNSPQEDAAWSNL